MDAKIIAYDSIKHICDDLRRSSRQIVFTNGCFDLLHVGHVRYLAKAKSAGDVLIVGLNSDESVVTIKGPLRPIVSQTDRAEVLAGLASVDYVVIFHQDNPLELIQLVRPDILVKGADWPEEEIVGAEFVKSNGGQVVRIAFESEISTTRMINRIRSLGKSTRHQHGS